MRGSRCHSSNSPEFAGSRASKGNQGRLQPSCRFFFEDVPDVGPCLLGARQGAGIAPASRLQLNASSGRCFHRRRSAGPCRTMPALRTGHCCARPPRRWASPPRPGKRMQREQIEGDELFRPEALDQNLGEISRRDTDLCDAATLCNRQGVDHVISGCIDPCIGKVSGCKGRRRCRSLMRHR